jgi:hypothetical protein
MVGSGIFQAKVNGRWVDLSSDIDPGEWPVNCWLEAQRPHRGWPADFEIVDGTRHPLTHDEVQLPEVQNSPLGIGGTKSVVLGQHARSWLHACEILEASEAELAKLRAGAETMYEVQSDADYAAEELRDMTDFFNEVNRLVALHGEVRLVFGMTY